MAITKLARRPPRVAFPAFTPGIGLSTFEDVEDRMNRFIERVMGNEPFTGTVMPETLGWIPAMDIVETPQELTITAELPGMDLKDIDVSVEEGVLTIRGEKVDERKEEEDKKVYLYERTFGSFNRSFALTPGIDPAKVTAEFAKGILKVHLPKTGEAKPKGRKIEVKTV